MERPEARGNADWIVVGDTPQHPEFYIKVAGFLKPPFTPIHTHFTRLTPHRNLMKPHLPHM